MSGGLVLAERTLNRRIAERALSVNLADRFLPVPHHVAHAASAYVPSGFPEALVVVSDGLGERHSTTALRAVPGRFEPLVAVAAHSSLGLLYGLVHPLSRLPIRRR